ncbi:VOC family protein [Halobacterium noricense]|uniref:VOC family protein n=1 Tax=Halobacterium noricense TaxID=223182 RepID=UPI001E32BB49|nr:VOC family protein [Halobacterium noricense]UHH23952.1 VOC family protein [Halobacterium noricense]
MTGLERIDHAKLHVQDLDTAVDFYTSAMGLVELSRRNRTAYLSTGLEGSFDLAVAEGGTGVEHVALRATNEAVVNQFAERLSSHDLDITRTGGTGPGIQESVRFKLPSGVPVEIVSIEEPEYSHADVSDLGRAGHAPSAIDHIQFFTPDLPADLSFLRDTVGLAVSDIAGPRDDPEIAFTRCNTFHHDIALKAKPELSHTSLHHFAWGFDSLEHMKVFLDTVTNRGSEFERGIGRHFAGNNLYAYIWEPGGNRFELCAEMAAVRTETVNHVEDYESATTAWGPSAPPSFETGSGLVRSDDDSAIDN